MTDKKSFKDELLLSTVKFEETEVCDNGDVMGYIDINGNGIEISINVYVSHDWRQGRFYDLEDIFMNKCEYVSEGPMYITNDPMRVKDILEDKFKEVMLAYWKSKFM